MFLWVWIIIKIAINPQCLQQIHMIQNLVNKHLRINSQETDVVYVEGYSGKIGCSQPVSEDRFKSMMKSIDNASFADDKVRVAKRIMKTNCLTIDNLVTILEEISFDEDQLELAKFAYDHVYDLENYYQVYDVFSFSKSGEELEEYIENR